jgi:hypothetical protein
MKRRGEGEETAVRKEAREGSGGVGGGGEMREEAL